MSHSSMFLILIEQKRLLNEWWISRCFARDPAMMRSGYPGMFHRSLHADLPFLPWRNRSTRHKQKRIMVIGGGSKSTPGMPRWEELPHRYPIFIVLRLPSCLTDVARGGAVRYAMVLVDGMFVPTEIGLSILLYVQPLQNGTNEKSTSRGALQRNNSSAILPVPTCVRTVR